ncbi:MAG: hypothetical protein Q9210_003787 [Variospora velana]
MRDVYTRAASILKTLTHDPVTSRTRDIKPGEDIQSIWDENQSAKFRLLKPLGKEASESTTFDEASHEGLDPKYFYDELDRLEDEVLFPEEHSAEASKTLYSGKDSALDDLINKGPSWERFIQPLGTDEEFHSDEDDNTLDGGSEVDESEDEEDEAEEEEEDVECETNEPALTDGSDECSDSDDSEEYLETRSLADGDDSRRTTKSARILDDKILPALSTKNEKADMANWRPPKDFRADVKADFIQFSNEAGMQRI